MEILPQRIIKTQADLFNFVDGFADFKELFENDFLFQLVNKGTVDSSLSGLTNQKVSVFDIESFDNLVMIGGSNVIIIRKNGDLVLPKISFLDLHQNCPNSINQSGKIINIVSLFEFLGLKIARGESVFLDFAYPILPVINQFGLADGILIPRSSGTFMRKGHNLEHAKDIRLGEYFGKLVGGQCTVVNDTITGLLPDFDINIIVGTGFNIGYRDGSSLVNLEASHFFSQYLPKIQNLAGDYHGIGLLISGGPQRIISDSDNWGIPGIFNCLTVDKKVLSAKEVFDLAKVQDCLAIAILEFVGLFVDSMISVVAKEIRITNPKIQFTGTVINALRERGYITF